MSHTLTTTHARRMGWQADLPDHRDHMFEARPPLLASGRSALPHRADLTPAMPPVYDQGELGSCTANAIAAALQFERSRQKLHDFVPSRLFIYYNERAMEGTVASDAGARIRDGIKGVASLGDCPESLWPYDVGRFADKPGPDAYARAVKYRVVSYQRVPRTLAQMRLCLAVGFPFVFGISVFESFPMEEGGAGGGSIPMPAGSERLEGGHAMLCVGYDDAAQRFLVRNSWGASWGHRGYGTIPYAYLLDGGLSSDFWTIRLAAG